MEGWRKAGVAIALLAMAAWSLYCAFFFFALATPAIEGAADVTAVWRLAILAGWLSGMVAGAIAILGLTTSRFAGVSAAPRAWLMAAALGTTGAAVVALYWLELSGLLLFFWAPLAATMLLLIAWAAGPTLRRRLALAAGAWIILFATVVIAWFVLPPRTLQFHFWTLLAVVTMAVIAWLTWPALRGAARRLAVNS